MSVGRYPFNSLKSHLPEIKFLFGLKTEERMEGGTVRMEHRATWESVGTMGRGSKQSSPRSPVSTVNFKQNFYLKKKTKYS